MIEIQVDGKPVTIDFFHSPFDSKTPNCRSTEAMIIMDNRIVSRGFSRCSELDNFNKTLGRKFALEDALSKVKSFDKGTKRDIWKQYFTKTNSLHKLYF